MKAKILFLASILVVLSGMLVVPGMAVTKAKACPGEVCIITPFGNPGQGDPRADNVEWCDPPLTCADCCEEECYNLFGHPDYDVVGNPNCYCTAAGDHRNCGDREDPEPDP